MNKFRISWFGAALVIIGAVILLDHLHVLYLPFSTVFWLLMSLAGLLISIRGFSLNRSGKIFWGTVLFLAGVYFLLRHSEYLEFSPFMFIPSFFMIFGIAFFMMFVNNISEWYLLIPSVILVGFGGLFLVSEYGYLSIWDVRDAIRMYWPLALILFGVAVLLRHRSRHQQQQQANVPPPFSPPPPVTPAQDTSTESAPAPDQGIPPSAPIV
jgi:hypothetical protein